MTITLTPELEHALAAQADQKGTTPELLALDALRERFLPAASDPSPTAEGTLADFLGEFIGAVHSGEHVPGGARMSENSARTFAAGLIRKRQAGRL